MTTIERINEMRLETDGFSMEAYLAAEAEMITLLGEKLVGSHLTCKGDMGEITAINGTNLEDIILEVHFDNAIRKFSLKYVMAGTRSFTSIDNEEIYDDWNTALSVHTEFITELKAIEAEAAKKRAEEAKLRAEEQKAEAKYKAQKAKAIKEFEEMAKQSTTIISAADEFYYSLGWLAKHVGTVTAALPDYLADSFAKYFGIEAPCRIVDSKKRGPAGWQSQWSWSFSASLKKAKCVPNFLAQHLNPSGKAVTNTSFVWDLVDNYGFQFGKKQEVEKIKQNVPAQFVGAFENGFAAA